MRIDWWKIFKVMGGVATLAIGWVGGSNQGAIMGQIQGAPEPSFFERRNIDQMDSRISDTQAHVVRIEQRFEKKFEIIDGKLDRIIELQLRPRVEKDAEISKSVQFQGG